MTLTTRAGACKITKTMAGITVPGPSSPRQVKVVQERAKRAKEEQPISLERMTTNSRTTQKTVQALKDKESLGGIKATEQYPGNQAAMHGPQGR